LLAELTRSGQPSRLALVVEGAGDRCLVSQIGPPRQTWVYVT
jgi:hypothetical protein